MCLIAFAIGAHPHCPLLVASNRDEYFDRPTAALHAWVPASGAPTIWGGRDLSDGGTWLGFADGGRVAMLTNVRQATGAAGSRSRGELTMRWLGGGCDVEALAAAIDPSAYGGFNLVVGNVRRGEWAWLSNRPPHDPHGPAPSDRLHVRHLAPGVYGLSNAALDTPWPKTVRLKAAVRRALERPDDDQQLQDRLAQVLADTTHAPDDLQPATGVPREVERALSSPFVDMVERRYGTRSSLIARMRPGLGVAWQLDLLEWTHPPPPATRRHAWGAQTPVGLQVAWS
jgi:uncharacterized protein with NRDE domain